MKPSVLLFLKIFTITALAYGSIQFLINYFFGDNHNLLRSLIFGLGFGLVMGIFHTYKQVREIKKLKGNDFTAEDLSVHQVAHFQSTLTKEQILAKLKNNYPSKDWELKEDADVVKIKTTFTAQSFGEKIQIKTEQLQNGLSEIYVESKPKTWFTIADYGKNLENITYLRKLLAA